MHRCNQGSLRCDENQPVQTNGVEHQVMVHCIHGVKGYSTLFGYVREESERLQVRLLAGNTIWEGYEGLGLERSHYIEHGSKP